MLAGAPIRSLYGNKTETAFDYADFTYARDVPDRIDRRKRHDQCGRHAVDSISI
jgi:hypothetical protein